MTGATTKVLYIAGVSRSGTTLLGMVLSQIDGWFDGGELRRLWSRGIVEHNRCGCGEPVSACPEWLRIGDLAFGGFDAVDVDAMLAADARLFRSRYLPLDLVRGVRSRRLEQERYYRTTLSRLYGGIAEATTSDVVVDSSKHPTYGAMLRSLPNLDVHTVHVIRDPRGVTHSRRQVKINPASGDAMGGVHPFASMYMWNVGNTAIERMLSHEGRYLQLRYEDFVAAPAEALERIAAFVAATTDGLSSVDLQGRTVNLRPTHSVSGNPMRFTAGPIEIRRDERWRTGLPTSTAMAVKLLTGPVAMRYGQFWRR